MILARGRAADILKKLAHDTGATAVHWNRRYEPAAVRCAKQVSEQLATFGLMMSGNWRIRPTLLLLARSCRCAGVVLQQREPTP